MELAAGTEVFVAVLGVAPVDGWVVRADAERVRVALRSPILDQRDVDPKHVSRRPSWKDTCVPSFFKSPTGSRFIDRFSKMAYDVRLHELTRDNGQMMQALRSVPFRNARTREFVNDCRRVVARDDHYHRLAKFTKVGEERADAMRNGEVLYESPGVLQLLAVQKYSFEFTPSELDDRGRERMLDAEPLRHADALKAWSETVLSCHSGQSPPPTRPKRKTGSSWYTDTNQWTEFQTFLCAYVGVHLTTRVHRDFEIEHAYDFEIDASRILHGSQTAQAVAMYKSYAEDVEARSRYKLGARVEEVRRPRARSQLTVEQQDWLEFFEDWRWERAESVIDSPTALFWRAMKAYVAAVGDACVEDSQVVDGYHLGLAVAERRIRFREGLLGAHEVHALTKLNGWKW
jgi:hypothetical protein